MISVDLNCDLGELEGDSGLQQDLAVLPWITSANAACGAHAGSPGRMRELAIACKECGVAFGAHPGFPDRMSFGRKVLELSYQQTLRTICEQLELAKAVAAAEGVRLAHIKPHGALYNLASVDDDHAACIVEAVLTTAPDACLFGLSGSRLIVLGRAAGLKTRSEVFADRNYNADGTLVPREHPQSMVQGTAAITARVLAMITDQSTVTLDGSRVPLTVETICIHSDTAGAVQIAECLYRALGKEPPPSKRS